MIPTHHLLRNYAEWTNKSGTAPDLFKPANKSLPDAGGYDSMTIDSMSDYSESPITSEQMEESIWSFLYSYWGVHVIFFSGTLLAAYLTGNHLFTSCAILPFTVHGLILALVDIIQVCRHYSEKRRFIPLYVVQYSLYLFFSGILIAGWLASYATGQYLYTAMGMFVYAVSPLFFSLYDLVKKNGRK